MNTRRLFFFSVLACLVVFAVSVGTFATTATVPTDEQMVVESRAIVTGRVAGIFSSVESSTDLVYTYIRLDVSAVLKGNIVSQQIVLKELGGETADHGTLVFGMPKFEVGRDVLVYLNSWPDGALRVHQGFLGKFDISRDPATGSEIVERQTEGQNVVIIAGSKNNGTNRSGLDSYVRAIEKLANTNAKKMLKFEQNFYANTPMLSEPNEFASKHSTGDFTPLWALLNPSSPARWFEADSGQPIVFYVNPAGAPSIIQVQADMQAAMDAWSNAGASIKVTYGGTTGGCGVLVADGQNTISFSNCDNYFSPSQSCSGLLAVSGIVRYSPSQTTLIGGTRYGKAIESNMSFNPYALCNFSTRCEIQEVITHEMGHALGLGHSTDGNATMYPYAHFDNRCGSLMADDIQGIRAIYPGGPSGGQLNIVTSALPDVSVDSDYSANLEATGGAGGYSWSTVSGQMPTGMRISLSGFIYGRAIAAGPFTFVAQVQDTEGTVRQRSFTVTVKQSGLSPVISTAEYRKKKVFLTGQNFADGATVYVDGVSLSATPDGTTQLVTQKRKQKAGVHQVYVVNPDGRQSTTFQFVVE